MDSSAAGDSRKTYCVMFAIVTIENGAGKVSMENVDVVGKSCPIQVSKECL